jgi:hypothetical protein
MLNFTAQDTLGILKASAALTPIMVAPGYVGGWALNLFEFRQRRPILRLILAIPLSIAICPMSSYLLARFFSPGLWLFYGGSIAACLLLLVKEARAKRRLSPSKYVWAAFALVVFWGVTALLSLVDLQIGDRLYPPIMVYDHSVRTAMTAAIARHVPPQNPFFANADAPLRYHYLWLLFCSLPMKVIHVSARHVVEAGVVWGGVGLICLIALGLKFLLGPQTFIERKALLAAALLCVTGLEILPALGIAFVYRLWLSDIEWLNPVQITSWAGSVLWVPHNVAALIACVVGFLLLRFQMDTRRRWATAPVIVAGMAFASAAGMSVYVTFTFVIAIGLWLLALTARKDWLEVSMFAAAGAFSLLWAFSFLSTLRGPATGGAFVEFALRPFPLGIDLAQKAGFHLRTPAAQFFANLLFLPINYVLELGFFLAIGILRLRQLALHRIETTANELASWTLVASSFLIGTFLRSSTIGANDLGWRCFLPAQLILLLWAAEFLHHWWFPETAGAPQFLSARWTRGVLAILLLLGVVGTAFQVFMLRMFPVLSDRGVIAGPGWMPEDRNFGKRAFALRSAYEALDRDLPPSAVFQNNPETENYILHMLYSAHDAAASNGRCSTDFGGDALVCDARLRRLNRIFNRSDPGEPDATCREYGIDAVLVEDSDGVWSDRSSWAWSQMPLFANDFFRAFRCGVLNDTHP